MGDTRTARGVVATARGENRVHARRISAQQRVHVAAVLIALCAATLFTSSLLAADDINFNPAITQAEFHEFSLLAGQAIYATPVEPARATGLLGFDVGIATTAVKIDTNANYYRRAVSNDFTTSGYLGVPRLVVSKGFPGGTISGMYARFNDTDMKVYGGSLDVPIVNGGLVSPTLALRGAYSTISGVDAYKLKTYGLELFLSKGFGPITPYIAAGRMRTKATGLIPAAAGFSGATLNDTGNSNRYTAGVRISMVVPKLVVEATQGEERSYAAKISIGF